MTTPAEIDQVDDDADDLATLASQAETQIDLDNDPEPNREVRELLSGSQALISELVAVNLFAGQFIWSAAHGWMRWSGKVWTDCTLEEVIEATRKWIFRSLERGLENIDLRRLDGTSLNTLEQRAVCKAFFHLAAATSNLERVIKITKGIECVFRDAAKFDQYPYLLNCQNGTVDLRTGDLLPHSPDRLITKITKAKYDPEATHEDWDKALQALPDDRHDWYQVRMGQTCIGEPPSDARLLINYGSGENGKSTLLDAISTVLGSYYTLVPDELLMGGQMHFSTPMVLQGVRMAAIEELPEGRHLNMQRVKKYLGTKEISGKPMHGSWVTFETTATPVINTNYKPAVSETDHGTWRRLIINRFSYRFRKPHEPLEADTDRIGDPGLIERMSKLSNGHGPAVLTWLINGARKYYEAGSQMPQLPASVQADTDEFRLTQDVLAQFLTEHMIFEQGWHVKSEQFRTAFGSWLVANGQRDWGVTLTKTRVEDHELIAKHGVKFCRTVKKGGPSFGKLSQPDFPESEPPPDGSVYRGWVGMRFRTKSDVSAV